MKKVYKYATGEEIPEGAVYLSTQVETLTDVFPAQPEANIPEQHLTVNKLVWHYFLVETTDVE